METEAIVLGLDVGGTRVRAALAQGQQVIASQSSTWPPGLSPADEVNFLVDLAQDLIRQTGRPQLLGAVGVSLAALVDQSGTVVRWPNRPAWQGVEFRSLLEARLHVPIVIEDDANAAALAEWTLGAGQGYQHLLVMMVGTGVGAGLILNGQLFRGQQGWAGELGHMVMQLDGPACACGHHGCLQTLASGRALEQIALKHGLPGATSVTVAAERGEIWAQEALAQSGRWLGLAVANVVNLLDLQAVIIGGGLSVLGTPWWSTLEETLQTNLLNSAHRQVILRRAALPDTAGVLGAIALARKLVAPRSSFLQEVSI